MIAIGNKMLYVGKTESDLYTIITRKFQEHRDTEYRRFTLNPENPEIRVSFTPMQSNTSQQIAVVEDALIKKYQPKHNKAGRFPGIQNHFVERWMRSKGQIPEDVLREQITTNYDDGEDLPF